MDLLRRAFRDIVAGRTPATILGRAAYIRHLSYEDQLHFDERRDRAYADARDAGVLTDEERLAALRKAGQWGDAQELEITRARQNLDSLREGLAQTRSRMPSAVKAHLNRIDEAQKQLGDKQWAKRLLMGRTCETIADEEVNEHYIVANLFADKALTEPLWPGGEEGEFGYLADSEVSAIVRAYNEAMDCCSEQNVKRLAMQPWFQSYFQLAGDDFTTCYGKPIFHLTFYQKDLLRWGAHFRHIYGSHDVTKWPKHVLEDPDVLTEYANTVAAKKGELEAQGANDPGAIVIGAKREDAKVLGLKSADPTQEIMTKHGGNVMAYFQSRG